MYRWVIERQSCEGQSTAQRCAVLFAYPNYKEPPKEVNGEWPEFCRFVSAAFAT